MSLARPELVIGGHVVESRELGFVFAGDLAWVVRLDDAHVCFCFDDWSGHCYHMNCSGVGFIESWISSAQLKC